MKFLRSRYVLYLILSILLFEALIRLGAYEPLVRPFSHSGTTIALKNALSEFGKANVNVVTFGDSKAVQGLNNRLIYETAREYGLGHVRMSMPGNHFLTYKTLAAWSIDELPELQGIVLALSPATFSRFGAGPYEIAKVLPLRSSTSTRKILQHVPFDLSDLRTWAAFSSIAGYRDDIKDLLTAPLQRWSALRRRADIAPLDMLAYNGRRSDTLCAVATQSPTACLAELERIRGDISAIQWNSLHSLCSAALKKRRKSEPGEAEDALISAWTTFLEKLSRNLHVLVVLLPDHSLYAENFYGLHASYVTNKVVTDLQERQLIQLLDMRSLITKQEAMECSFYMDSKHLNKQGKAVLSKALLPALKEFWQQLEKPVKNR